MQAHRQAADRIREALKGKSRVNRFVMRHVKGKQRRCHEVSLAALIARDVVDVAAAIPVATRSQKANELAAGAAAGKLDREIACQVTCLDVLLEEYEAANPPPATPGVSGQESGVKSREPDVLPMAGKKKAA